MTIFTFDPKSYRLSEFPYPMMRQPSLDYFFRDSCERDLMSAKSAR
ncbi:hypothetical protein ACCQ05_13940 [Xanthomonas sp. NCPPB 3582]